MGRKRRKIPTNDSFHQVMRKAEADTGLAAICRSAGIDRKGYQAVYYWLNGRKTKDGKAKFHRPLQWELEQKLFAYIRTHYPKDYRPLEMNDVRF